MSETIPASSARACRRRQKTLPGSGPISVSGDQCTAHSVSRHNRPNWPARGSASRLRGARFALGSAIPKIAGWVEEMLQALLTKVKNLIEGDPGVRKVADDPVLSAELLLLFRM